MPKIVVLDGSQVPNPEDMAMLQALYSRSPASVGEHLKKVESVGSGAFVQKYLVQYGHRSIGDCGNTTIFIEGVTMLMAKAIQDWPLYSGQEASTRYMDFSEAEFANPLGTPAGEQIQEAWRDFYLGAQEPVRVHLREKYPRQACVRCKGNGEVDENASIPEISVPCPECNGVGIEDEKVYERAIDARSFDILRSFLPAGAATNLSWSTNLRQAQDHLMWLLHHPALDVQALAIDLAKSLRVCYPHSFSFKESPEASAFVREVMRDYYFLTSPGEPYCFLSADFRQAVIADKLLDLLKRRPRGQEIPWFLAELGSIQSEFLLDFGSFRDLQRHRNGTIRMPLLTTKHGFHPWYIQSLPAKIGTQAIELMADQKHAISKLDCDDVTRQNYIAMGYQAPCRVTQSLPAFVYRLELRSGKTVHPTLRQVIHEEILQFKQFFPSVTLHVDMDPDSWTVRRGKQTIEEKE